MKRALGLVVAILLASTSGYAGNVDNVTGQSAQSIRSPSRQASTDVDAAYYNPSGLAKLPDGFYFEFSNLTILKKDTIITEGQTYTAENPVLLFPTISMAYKIGSLGAYLSLHIPGGGGSVHYYGHPLFNGSEAAVAAVGATKSDFIDGAVIKESEVVGKSVYYGASLGVVYDISGMFSLSLGGRLVSAQKHIQTSVTYGLTSSALGREATTFTGEIDVEQAAMGIGLIAGLSFYPLDGLIFSLKYESITGLEFENTTHQDFTETSKDKDGNSKQMFPNGGKHQRDMPALGTAGVSWEVLDGITINAGYTYYFTTDAVWQEATGASRNRLEHYRDGWDASGSILYKLNDNLGISAGAVRTINAHNKHTRTTTSFGSNSWMYGGGVVFYPYGGEGEQNDLEFNLGFADARYDDRKNLDKSIAFKQHKFLFGFGVATRFF